MFDEGNMYGTNCIAWFKVKTTGLKTDAIKQLIKDMQEGTGLAPQADPFGKKDDSNWLLYGVYDSVGENPDEEWGKDKEFLERWEYGITVWEIVDEKVLKDLYGKEDVLLKLKEKYGVEYWLYFCTFIDIYHEDDDGYGDNDISLSPKAMAFLSKIGASDYLRVLTYHSDDLFFENLKNGSFE